MAGHITTLKQRDTVSRGVGLREDFPRPYFSKWSGSYNQVRPSEEPWNVAIRWTDDPAGPKNFKHATDDNDDMGTYRCLLSFRVWGLNEELGIVHKSKYINVKWYRINISWLELIYPVFMSLSGWATSLFICFTSVPGTEV